MARVGVAGEAAGAVGGVEMVGSGNTMEMAGVGVASGVEMVGSGNAMEMVGVGVTGGVEMVGSGIMTGTAE
ncbi:hypothetical protein C0991_008718, partial [Blastosporella zonata]